MKDEAHYNTQALKARRLAVLSRDDYTRKSWAQIADHYEALAVSTPSFYSRVYAEPLTEPEQPLRIGGPGMVWAVNEQIASLKDLASCYRAWADLAGSETERQGRLKLAATAETRAAEIGRMFASALRASSAHSLCAKGTV